MKIKVLHLLLSVTLLAHPVILHAGETLYNGIVLPSA